MELHMINITYAALHMSAQTEKTKFTCKDDCTLTKHTRRWTYSALRYSFVRFFFFKDRFTCVSSISSLSNIGMIYTVCLSLHIQLNLRLGCCLTPIPTLTKIRTILSQTGENTSNDSLFTNYLQNWFVWPDSAQQSQHQ